MTEVAPPLWAPSGRQPEDPALDDGMQALTWGELEERTNALGRGVGELGLAPGDHVTLMATNRAEFVVALVGCIRAGMVVTPVKTGWTEREISYLTADAGSRLVVTDRDAARRAASVAGVALLDLDAGFEEWLVSQAGAPLPVDRAGWRLPYTSGTTGHPKGVVPSTAGTVPFTAAWEASTNMAARLGLPRDGWHLAVSRLCHGAPLNFALAALASGAPLRILRSWEPSGALVALGGGVTSTCMVPTMFRQLLALPAAAREGFDPSGLRTVVHGGEPCPVELKRRMIEWWGPVLVEYFGFTEGGMTTVATEEWLARPGTVGRPQGQRVIVRGDDGSELPANMAGRIYFSPPDDGRRNFSYRNDPAKTAHAHGPEGSFTAGDIGWLDEEGYLYISGRESEVIVSAGVNVYPAEVESAILGAPEVSDACVVGGPDPERGERVVAYVVPATGTDPSGVVAAVNRAAEQLAPYQRPSEVVASASVPRDETGKLLRSTLRARLWGDESPFAAPAPQG